MTIGLHEVSGLANIRLARVCIPIVNKTERSNAFGAMDNACVLPFWMRKPLYTPVNPKND
jgi:hypothetical protein